MPVFKFEATIVREIEEVLQISISSDDKSEATDKAYDVAAFWPSSEISAERALVTKRYHGPISKITFTNGMDDESEPLA